MGKLIMLFGHRMKMSGILYYSKEKSGTFYQPYGVQVAQFITITQEFCEQTKYNLTGKAVNV